MLFALCIRRSSGSDSTKHAPNNRNSCSNESISACRITWPFITARLIATGTPAPLADSKALMVLNGQVMRQALMLSFEQLFLLFGACFVLSLPLLLLMHKAKSVPGGSAAH